MFSIKAFASHFPYKKQKSHPQTHSCPDGRLSNAHTPCGPFHFRQSYEYLHLTIILSKKQLLISFFYLLYYFHIHPIIFLYLKTAAHQIDMPLPQLYFSVSSIPFSCPSAGGTFAGTVAFIAVEPFVLHCIAVDVTIAAAIRAVSAPSARSAVW